MRAMVHSRPVCPLRACQVYDVMQSLLACPQASLPQLPTGSPKLCILAPDLEQPMSLRIVPVGVSPDPKRLPHPINRRLNRIREKRLRATLTRREVLSADSQHNLIQSAD